MKEEQARLDKLTTWGIALETHDSKRYIHLRKGDKVDWKGGKVSWENGEEGIRILP